MWSPNLRRSEGRRPSHITLGTVRLWASNDMACGKKQRAHKHTHTHAQSDTQPHDLYARVYLG